MESASLKQPKFNPALVRSTAALETLSAHQHQTAKKFIQIQSRLEQHRTETFRL